MTRLTRWLRATAERLLTENTSPARLGVAVGVGVVFACTPFYGFQLVLALAVAWLFRLNKLAVAAGTQFSFPPLIPFIVFASAWIGEWIVHRRAFNFSLSELRAAPIGEVAARLGLAWLVGGLVVGLVAGSVVGGTVFLIARRKARSVSPTADPTPPYGPTID